MKIINKAARLITFTFKKVKYQLLPAGDAVEIPDEALQSQFLRSLLSDGSASYSGAGEDASKEYRDLLESESNAISDKKDAAEDDAAKAVDAMEKMAEELSVAEGKVREAEAQEKIALENAAMKKESESKSVDSDPSAIDQLRDDAAELGIEVDKRWGEARLKEETEKGYG